MKIPLSLITSYIQLDLSPAEIAKTLTLLGIEVDEISQETPRFKGIVAAEVVSTAPHPDAKRLQIAQVDCGEGIIQVVCAGVNCRPGLKTALAKPGSYLIDSQGEKRVIEACSLRGVPSHGMLCAADELGLEDSSEGILELPHEIENGQDLISILWDPVFSISLTPNLGHCMSALGLARELSAALKIPLKKSKISSASSHKSEKSHAIKISIHETKCCPRYACQLIENVQIGPSPFWLKQQLIACGLTPISNAVDISNYIMLKTGQPLHMFDYDRIEGKTLHIAPLETSQSFAGLDGQERTIPNGTLLISDQNRPIAIAGILGGSNSAVTANTRNLLIEAAVFDPAVIRKAIRSLDLRTESAQRFEKGIDPNGTLSALAEAASLVQELCKGKASQHPIEEAKLKSFEPREIRARIPRINQLLGTKLSLTEINDIFSRLGFSTTVLEQETLNVKVPRFRSDIAEEIDLVEEVARIYGYNNIEKSIARSAISPIAHDPMYLFETEIRQALTGLGLQEFLTADLISPELANLSSEWPHLTQMDPHRHGRSPKETASEMRLLKALHPKTEEYSILRPSLLPGLCQVAAKNFDHKNLTFHGFELGRIHFLESNRLIEQSMAAIILAGKAAPSHWSAKSQEVDFFDLKGLIENLFESLAISSIHFSQAQHPSFHPGRQANLNSNELLIGSFGELHPHLLAKLGIKHRLLYAELNLQHLLRLRKSIIHMHPIAKFPSSERDWTIPLPSAFKMQHLFDAIQTHRPPLLEKTELVDLYIPEQGEQKNASFRFTYRDPFKTISFEEVESQHSALIEKVLKSAKLD